MDYIFKTYIDGEKEIFEYTASSGFIKTLKKEEYKFSQTLLDFLYMDVLSLFDLFDSISTNIKNFFSTKEKAFVTIIKDELNTLSDKHIYFELLKLEWFSRLDAAERENYIGSIDLLLYKRIAKIPENILNVQHQLKSLFYNVLDASVSKKNIKKRLADYYLADKTSDNVNEDKYRFHPINISYELCGKTNFTQVLYPKDVYEIVEFFLRECILREQLFRKCKNCGMYFPITGYINSQYCERTFDESGRTCKEIGALRTFKSKIDSDPVLGVYNKEYKKRFAWIRYGKITREDFHTWSAQARILRDKCLQGEISADEFKKWLSE